MTRSKKVGLVLLVALAGIQFIRPDFNSVGSADGADGITQVLSVPNDVKALLTKACYDCHSNHTNPMWYMNVQPVGWWVGHHIEEGKEELNFSTFKSYSLKRQIHKLEEIAEQIEENEMPLSSYTWSHGEAKLTQEEKLALVTWANGQKIALEQGGTNDK